MKKDRTGRRAFLRSSITTAGVAWAATRSGSVSAQESAPPPKPARIRFAAIGLNHGHINGQVDSVIRGGGELVCHSNPVALQGLGPAALPYLRDHKR